MVRKPTRKQSNFSPAVRPAWQDLQDQPEEVAMTKLAVTLLVAFGLLASSAQAAPPGNDDRGSAQALAVPSTVRGTTVDATLEAGEPFSSCAGGANSVWYEIAPSAARDLVLELDAAGDLDAVVDVYRRTRSQLSGVTCGQTDRRGRLTLDFSQPRNAELLVRVAQRENSSSDAFSLRVVAPDKPERPPGRALGRSGASASVDRIANPDDAYAVSMRAGTTYRVHLVSRERCVAASLYPPGTSSFEEGSPVRTFDCDAYFIYTPGPGEGGRYSIQVRAPRSRRGALPYHVQVARAGEDDPAPGAPLANDVRVRGALRGSGADVLDLYRFDVRRPSILDLRLRTGGSTPFNLQLVGEGGRRIACACGSSGSQQIRLKLKPGRYFAAVRSRSGADGRYVLSRLTRVITKTRVLVDGKRDADVRPGRSVAIGVRITPGESGPVTVDVERFDPLAGWQFHERFQRRAAGGTATIAFTPPTVGRWRVRATYDGTRTAAPSGPSVATFTVAEPLEQP
jgi:hypothetical protein